MSKYHNVENTILYRTSINDEMGSVKLHILYIFVLNLKHIEKAMLLVYV